MGLCAQNNAVEITGPVQDIFAQGCTVLFQADKTDVVVFVFDTQAELTVECIEQGHRRIYNLRADTVAGQDEELDHNGFGDCLL